VKYRNQGFIESNLIDAAFDSTGLRLNLMIYLNTSGEVVFEKGYDFHNNRRVSVPNGFIEHLSRSVLLNHPTPESFARGLVMLPDGQMMISSRPVITSEEVGPIRGTLIMGRHLDLGETKRLGEMTQLSVSTYPKTHSSLPRDVQTANTSFAKGVEIFHVVVDEMAIAGYANLDDIYGEPALTLKVQTPRDLYDRGRATVSYFVLFLLGAGLVCGALVMWSLERTVLKRVADMAEGIARIGESHNLSDRVLVTGQDELSVTCPHLCVHIQS
jgi:sensor domain CHASE-containing protein